MQPTSLFRVSGCVLSSTPTLFKKFWVYYHFFTSTPIQVLFSAQSIQSYYFLWYIFHFNHIHPVLQIFQLQLGVKRIYFFLHPRFIQSTHISRKAPHFSQSPTFLAEPHISRKALHFSQSPTFLAEPYISRRAPAFRLLSQFLGHSNSAD